MRRYRAVYLLIGVLLLHGPVSGASHDACVPSEVANRYLRCKSNPLVTISSTPVTTTCAAGCPLLQLILTIIPVKISGFVHSKAVSYAVPYAVCESHRLLAHVPTCDVAVGFGPTY